MIYPILASSQLHPQASTPEPGLNPDRAPTTGLSRIGGEEADKEGTTNLDKTGRVERAPG
jgi:hypothetical protein